MRAQPGFFDLDDRMNRLSDLGDQLEAVGSAVDFEIFAAISFRLWPIRRAAKAVDRRLIR